MDPSAVAKVVVLSVLIPLALGILFRNFAPELAARIAGPTVQVAGIVLLIGMLCILVLAYRAVWSLVGDGTIIAFIAFILAGLLVGHLSGGPDRDSRVALALSTACRHPALALAIAAANIPNEHRVVGAILLYAVLNVVLTIPYVAWQRKRIQEHTGLLKVFRRLGYSQPLEIGLATMAYNIKRITNVLRAIRITAHRLRRRNAQS
jgi:bile acid:Na+ symporter, BASS family